MKQNNRQTSPFGRSTKADNAGLSLLQPASFSFEGQVIKYYNETSKNTSDFFARLISKKFLSFKSAHIYFHRSYDGFYLINGLGFLKLS